MAQTNVTEDRFYRGGQRQVLALSVDEATDDSDKTITVPAGKVWEIRSLHTEWTLSTTTDTNRTPTLHILDASADVTFLSTGDAITGSTTTAVTGTRVWYPGAGTEKAGEEPMPLVVLPAGWGIRVLDSAAIAATEDDLNIQLLVEQYDVIAA
jgi:hypothetical protein